LGQVLAWVTGNVSPLEFLVVLKKMISSDQPSCVIAIAGPSGAGKTTLVKLVTQLLGDAVTFYFDDYSEYPDDLTQWVAQGADPKQWPTPHLVTDLQTLKFGMPIVLSELAHQHRAAIGEKEFSGMLKPAQFIVTDEPFGRERPGMDRLVDFVVGVNTPLDIALARKLLRDIGYHTEGVFRGDLIEYLKGELEDYQLRSREIYLATCRVVMNRSDLMVDGTRPAEEIAKEIVQKLKSYCRTNHPSGEAGF
jgi:uridine kinase